MPTPQDARPQVPSSLPVRVEVRINGRVQFSNVCWNPTMTADGEKIIFAAALQPVLVDAPEPQEAPQHEFEHDARNGDEIIQQVHSGRRNVKRAGSAPQTPLGATRGADNV